MIVQLSKINCSVFKIITLYCIDLKNRKVNIFWSIFFSNRTQAYNILILPVLFTRQCLVHERQQDESTKYAEADKCLQLGLKSGDVYSVVVDGPRN